jgi:peptidyl-prolyl cis-trans isomerase SurA
MLKKLLLTSCLLSSLMGLSVAYAVPATESLDEIVAIVNEDVITRTELSSQINVLKAQNAEVIGRFSAAEIRKQALNSLINKKLQLQIAKLAGIKVTEAELDAAIATVAEQNQVGVADLYKRLAQEGMTIPGYRKEMREEMIVHKLQQQEVVSHIRLTPQEMSHFMQKADAASQGPKSYRLQDILVPLKDHPSTQAVAAAKKMANDIVATLQAQKPLSASQLKATQNQDLGWRRSVEIPTLFAAAVQHMQVKQVAGPFEAGNGIHVIRLKAVRAEGGNVPSKQQVEEMLLQRKFVQAVQTWLSKLRSQAFISTNLSQDKPTQEKYA